MCDWLHPDGIGESPSLPPSLAGMLRTFYCKRVQYLATGFLQYLGRGNILSPLKWEFEWLGRKMSAYWIVGSVFSVFRKLPQKGGKMAHLKAERKLYAPLFKKHFLDGLSRKVSCMITKLSFQSHDKVSMSENNAVRNVREDEFLLHRTKVKIPYRRSNLETVVGREKGEPCLIILSCLSLLSKQGSR